MKPLYPAIFKAEESFAFKWAKRPENRSFFHHLMNVCKDFPSVLMSYSAVPGMPEITAEIGKSLIDAGVNVFLPSEASPICAFSQSISARQVPMGLYVSYDRKSELYSMAAITNYGGPINEKDVNENDFEESDRAGVLGTTEYSRIYLNNLTGFADQFIEDGPGFRSISIPFPEIEGKLREIPELSILFKTDLEGPDAIISADGQGIEIRKAGNSALATEEICEKIIHYLVKERRTSGTVVGPAGRVQPAVLDGEVVEVDGNLFDMNYNAGFSDLLVGWWDDGIIAHQGSSCFGDGILTAIYYLEALRS